jgi:hypothetical protein
MGKFQKGNPGRPKGSLNKKTSENRARVQKVISHLYNDYLMEDLQQIGPSERVRTLIALMEYSLPKLQRVAHEGKEGDDLFKDLVINVISAKKR